MKNYKPTTRAKFGARFLDKVLPNWFKNVKITKLDQSKGYASYPGDCGCILAQTHGSFSEGADQLNIDDTDLLGFSAAPTDKLHDEFDNSFKAYDKDYELLTEAWKDEIRKRRAA